MKKLTLTLCAMMIGASAALAGTGTWTATSKHVAPAPCPTWYADNEWNIGLSGAYAWNRNDNAFTWDDAWGGALDVKYFFRRYFGVGVQGFGLGIERDDRLFGAFRRNNDDWAWGVLGTFTFRYPIPCSRFAPYAWVGLGGVWLDQDDGFFGRNFPVAGRGDDSGNFMGQYGIGFEVRFTQHIGWTNDFSYNDVEGGRHDFFMVRTGLNFAF